MKTPIRVVYDHHTFTQQRVGGISRYFLESANRIAALPDFEVRILAVGHVNEYLKTSPNPQIIHGMARPDLKRTTQIADKVNRAAWHLLRARFKPHILHETYYAYTGLPAKGVRRVTTVYDFIQEHYGHLIASSKEVIQQKKASIRRADHILCISESTRRDLLERYSVAPEKVSVIPLSGSRAVSAVIPECPITEPFVLYVGSRALYKNFEGAIKAFGDPSLWKNLLLVCFGGGKLTAKEQEWISQAGIPAERVQQFSGDDDLLTALYRSAVCLIYPSFYEGFGIPLLEAMEQGCPVICSNTSSLPEVAGDAAILFDPNAVDAIRDALKQIIDSPEIRQQLKQRGAEQVKLFTWERCAEKTAAVYRSLMD